MIISRRHSRRSASAPNGIRSRLNATASMIAMALTWSGLWVSWRT